MNKSALDWARKALTYDQETGEFRYRIRAGRMVPGDLAGYIRVDGYRVLNCDGKILRAHRIALEFSGISTAGFDVDHINGDRGDNRFCNLRLTTRAENASNRTGPDSDASSGILGVHFSRERGLWCAQLKISGKQKNLGRFKTREEAVKAHRAAKIEHHPYWNGTSCR